MLSTHFGDPQWAGLTLVTLGLPPFLFYSHLVNSDVNEEAEIEQVASVGATQPMAVDSGQPMAVDSGPDSDENISPFGFISEGVAQPVTSGFSFLNVAAELQDDTVESHDISYESPDVTLKSCDESSVKSPSPDMIIEADSTCPDSAADRVSESVEVTAPSPIAAVHHPVAEHLVPPVLKQRGKKKKKKKAVRPGQSSQEDSTNLSDPDVYSISSHASVENMSHESSVDKGTPASPIGICDPYLTEHRLSASEDASRELPHQIEELHQSCDETDNLVESSKIKNETIEQPIVSSELGAEVCGLSNVFVSPNYDIELSARDCLATLLEGCQSGLEDIR